MGRGIKYLKQLQYQLNQAEVKVNDRGPFIEGRILDLSFAAALELEMVKQGTAKVMIEITRPVE